MYDHLANSMQWKNIDNEFPNLVKNQEILGLV